MKKIFVLVLTLIIAIIFVACGANNEIAVGTSGMPTSPDTYERDTRAPSETVDLPFPTTNEPAGSPDETPSSPPEPPVLEPDFSDLNIRSAAWENVEWEYYTSIYFTLTIPKGWEVQWQGDANQMQWMAVSPDKTVGISNMDHAYACKDARAQGFLGFLVSMTGGTVQEYFEATFQNSTDYFTVMNSCVPDNIDLISQIRPYDTIRDYQSLYAVFKDENVEGEGIYSAVVMDSQDVWFNGLNYGAWEVNCIITEWAPQGDLVNWAPVIAQIARSFNYTDTYIRQWQSIAQSALTPYNSVSDTDPVMEAFEERSKSDTIIQEKRSDMIGEYERVYDNDTGNIYRAYNGFLDDIGDQNRFTPITDSQYTEGYVGWIDKN